jgi:hypothetical protein
MIDRSRFGPIYNFEIGAWYPGIEGVQARFPISWHISAGADIIYGLATGDRKLMVAALDELKEVQDDERKRRLVELVDFAENEFFANFSTCEAMEEIALAPKVPGILCSRVMREYAEAKAAAR